MILIACVSKKMGLSFNNRRVSRDQVAIQDILKMVGENHLYVAPQTLSLFEDSKADNVTVSTNYLQKAGNNDYVLYESGNIKEIEPRITEIVLYNWNRDYPDDTKFVIPKKFLLDESKSVDIQGKSHERITRQHYTKGD